MELKVVVQTVFILALLAVVFFCLCAFVLLKGKNRQETPNQLAASIMIAHAFFTLMHNSGTFHMYAMDRKMSDGFCWIWAHLEIMYHLVVPLSLMVITIERLIFIKDPIGYGQKLSKIGIIVMLAFPFVVSLIFGFVAVIASNGVVTEYELHYFVPPNENHTDPDKNITVNQVVNETKKYCFLDGSMHLMYHDLVMNIVFALCVLCSFVCTITVLVMWCCYRCRHARGTDYSMMGEEIESMVKHSVIAMAILNIVFILFAVGSGIVFLSFASTNSLFGIIQGIIFILAYRNARLEIAQICCRRRANNNPVEFTQGNEEDE